MPLTKTSAWPDFLRESATKCGRASVRVIGKGSRNASLLFRRRRRLRRPKHIIVRLAVLFVVPARGVFAAVIAAVFGERIDNRAVSVNAVCEVPAGERVSFHPVTVLRRQIIERCGPSARPSLDSVDSIRKLRRAARG